MGAVPAKPPPPLIRPPDKKSGTCCSLPQIDLYYQALSDGAHSRFSGQYLHSCYRYHFRCQCSQAHSL